MSQEIDDFTIVLPEVTNMATCKLKMYDGLDRLWRMAERYKMTAPIVIRVVDNKTRCIRTIRGTRHQANGWQLEDEVRARTAFPRNELANDKGEGCQGKHSENETSLRSRRAN
jgi:hypothetical protein